MKKGFPVYLNLLLTTVFFLLWSEVKHVDSHPLNDKLYVNVPGNKVLSVRADPSETSASELKVKLTKEMQLRNLEPLDMSGFVLIYFEMIIDDDRRKLTYYHVPKGATLYLVKDVFNF